jgi:hypothetical protein
VQYKIVRFVDTGVPSTPTPIYPRLYIRVCSSRDRVDEKTSDVFRALAAVSTQGTTFYYWSPIARYTMNQSAVVESFYLTPRFLPNYFHINMKRAYYDQWHGQDSVLDLFFS